MSTDTPLSRPALRLLPRSRLTVGTILREPVETVVRFVAWYLAQEADRIVLCFDDPADPAADLMSGVSRVEVIRCTTEFWQRLGLDPAARFTKRQNAAMSHVYDTVCGGWFLNVDSDELLHLDGRTLAEEVQAQPKDVPTFRVEPVEHLQTPDSPGHHFRCLMKPWMQRRVYGDLAPAMKVRAGLMGHVHGKSCTRAGLPGVTLRQHWAQGAGGDPIEGPVLGRAEGAHLLHFVDQGFETWRAKLPWRLSSRGFRGPIREVISAALDLPDPVPELRRLYDLFFVFDRDRLDLLGEVRARLDLDVTPDDLIGPQLGSELLFSTLRAGAGGTEEADLVDVELAPLSFDFADRPQRRLV
ncbi:glycosyltransferase family 2 protein [Pseudooceanicola onchidii]|uniref:glycosyltransferase family 2 protein n=1 Tax=Pseudooceanicola onchidii TaxID=2562279 RepID=UPI0010AB1E21|nr:glycosyltransferase family 2 protein [Pseudooceanicola onchidii]